MSEFAATPRNSNGLLVAVEDSMNIVLVRPRAAGGELWRHTVTNVDDLIEALNEARVNRDILEELHRKPLPPTTRKAYLVRWGNVVLVGSDKRRLVVDHLVNLPDDVRIVGSWADNGDPAADFLHRMRNMVEVTVPAFSDVEVER